MNAGVGSIWEVFYAPHTDDESIAMAGAIVNAKELGHSVLVCLVTDNKPSERGRRLFPGIDVCKARRAEWMNALSALHVDEVQMWELPEDEMLVNPHRMQQAIRDRMIIMHKNRPVIHHHTTWGLWDRNLGIGSVAHDLCAAATHQLVDMVRSARVNLYAVYEYSKPKEKRYAPVIRQLSVREHAQKRNALRAYCQSDQSIGYGYTSVPELIDAASTDAREFIMEVSYGRHNSTPST